MRKIVEIGLRGVSPSLNDPYTAATCIHRLTPVLTLLAQRDTRASAFYDDDDRLRLLTVDFCFEDYLFKAFHEIRSYGGDDATVVAAILESLTMIAASDGHEQHQALWRFGAEAVTEYDRRISMDAGRDFVRSRFAELAGATGHHDEYERAEALSPRHDLPARN